MLEVPRRPGPSQGKIEGRGSKARWRRWSRGASKEDNLLFNARLLTTASGRGHDLCTDQTQLLAPELRPDVHRNATHDRIQATWMFACGVHLCFVSIPVCRGAKGSLVEEGGMRESASKPKQGSSSGNKFNHHPQAFSVHDSRSPEPGCRNLPAAQPTETPKHTYHGCVRRGRKKMLRMSEDGASCGSRNTLENRKGHRRSARRETVNRRCATSRGE